jgi:hypothetical protein
MKGVMEWRLSKNGHGKRGIELCIYNDERNITLEGEGER